VKKGDIIAPKLCEKHDKKRLGRRPGSGDANRIAWCSKNRMCRDIMS